MGSFAVGDVVLIAFPFADFSSYKVRPAIVVGLSEFDNLIVCQVTSKQYSSRTAIKLTDASFSKGSLKVTSYARPDKLFTIEKSMINNKVGALNAETQAEIKSQLEEIFKIQ